MHSMAAKRGFTHFGWQLFVALMTADINKSDLPENRPQAKQHKHCPKCNSINIDTGMMKIPDSNPPVYGLWLRCQNCGMQKLPQQKDWK